MHTQRSLFRVVFLVLAMVLVPVAARAQSGTPNSAHQQMDFDSLSPEVANEWAGLVLKSVDTEYPNKMSLVYKDDDDVQSPQENFPAFYGCFDWHSSVHGHWLLARLLRSFPELPLASKIRNTLQTHLNAANLKQEAEFFSRDQHKSFERMYGWAWYLRLAMELDRFDDPDAQRWRQNLKPLESVLVQRIHAYLPLLSYPIRIGQHTDTGFALAQILDYARAHEHQELESLVIARAKEFYSTDRDYPFTYEPSGHDFFSSGWNEADLMRRVLTRVEFVTWFDRFAPHAATQLSDGTVQPVKVTDVTDGKLVHLAGLNLNRAWCLRSISNALPGEHPVKQAMLASATKHLGAGLDYVNSGHYEGDHWLATFALYAITELGESPVAGR